jgi:predicted transposase YbfD/YdcC
LIVLRSERTVKKTGDTTTESRYFVSSASPQEHPPGQWLALIRGHWGGVEIRNHWRRDVLMGEDQSRSRNANLLANLSLIRNALLLTLADHIQEQSLPEFRDSLRSCPKQCLYLIAKL